MSLRIQQSCGETRVFECNVREAKDELDREDLNVLPNRRHVVFLEDQPEVLHHDLDDILARLLYSLLPVGRRVDRGVQQLDHDKEELPYPNVESMAIGPGLVLLLDSLVVVR